MTSKEERNSLVPINLLPLDILLLISTHLTSLRDRLRVTFVCRHWRQAFLQHAQLWSQLTLTKTTDRLFLTTFLERAKQFPLDITLRYSWSPIQDVILLFPFAQQIATLIVGNACQADIQNLSVVLSGPLPLLRTLSIEDPGYAHHSRPPFDPKSPLFSGAVNVRKLTLHVCHSSFFSQLAFQNLTTLDFLGMSDDYPVSQLLDFLEASPSLQKIKIIIDGRISQEDVPLDRVLVLPCVKEFLLTFPNNSRGWELPTHLSCPSATRVHFRLQRGHHGLIIYNSREDIYPLSLPWSAIVHQYTMGKVDEVQLKFRTDKVISCSVAFFSLSHKSTLVLHCDHSIEPISHRGTAFGRRAAPEIFSGASRIIRDHPWVGNIRHLYIQGGDFLMGDLELTANDVGKLLGSLGSLERLCLDKCDLRPYLDPFLETPLCPNAIRPTSFPPIKEFTIISPGQSLRDDEAYAAAIVELAKSQHARGIPFERVTIRTLVPFWVAQELLLSVNIVECREVF